jgi:UDP-N-acetylmuramate dehydrogenase
VRPVAEAVPLRTQVSVADLTTLSVGGPAERLIEVRTAAELIEAVRSADDRGEPVLLIGGGSNLVVADDGFPGLVILVRTSGVSQVGGRLVVAAGEPWDDLVSYAVTAGLAGIECLAGIPGLVGATPIQNVGAYGQEVADVVTRVRAYDRSSRKLRDLPPAQCGFSYRSSRFKAEAGRWVVTEVEFTLRPSRLAEPVRYAELSGALSVPPESAAPLTEVRDAVLSLRRGKGMVLDPRDPDTRSSGSFFTNPILDRPAFLALTGRAGAQLPSYPEPDDHYKVSAAWLIDRSGFPKGYWSGAARLSTKHVLAVTNPGGATAAEVVTLAREIRDRVRERFGVTLVNEPVLVGLEL